MVIIARSLSDPPKGEQNALDFIDCSKNLEPSEKPKKKRIFALSPITPPDGQGLNDHRHRMFPRVRVCIHAEGKLYFGIGCRIHRQCHVVLPLGFLRKAHETQRCNPIPEGNECGPAETV